MRYLPSPPPPPPLRPAAATATTLLPDSYTSSSPLPLPLPHTSSSVAVEKKQKTTAMNPMPFSSSSSLSSSKNAIGVSWPSPDKKTNQQCSTMVVTTNTPENNVTSTSASTSASISASTNTVKASSSMVRRPSSSSSSSSPAVVTTAKSARNFWQEKISHQTGTMTVTKKNPPPLLQQQQLQLQQQDQLQDQQLQQQKKQPQQQQNILGPSPVAAAVSSSKKSWDRSLKYHRKDDTWTSTPSTPSTPLHSKLNNNDDHDDHDDHDNHDNNNNNNHHRGKGQSSGVSSFVDQNNHPKKLLGQSLPEISPSSSPPPPLPQPLPSVSTLISRQPITTTTTTTITTSPTPTNDNHNGIVGEMQIKLDIAEAKILTEEMKYKDIQEQMETLKDTFSRRIQELEDELNVQQKNYQLTLSQKEKQCKNQKQEIDELCVEIERLHESHRAERNVIYQRESKSESADMTMVVPVDDDDMTRQLQSQVEEKNTELKRVMEDLERVKTELEDVTTEFKNLQDETERLEIELETVTEDRDELLRRTIVYHKQAQNMAQSQTSPEQAAKKSLSESSRQDYEAEQHQAEIGRLTNTLNELRQTIKMKDCRIRELQEGLLEEGKVKAFELDLSAIEVENTSLLVDDREARSRLEEQENSIQNECSRLTMELEDAMKNLASVQIERDRLKQCLADAMKEIELYEANEDEKERANNKIIKDLMQVIKEKDAEIEMINDQINGETRLKQFAKNTSADSFHEDFKNVIEWLDSSTRINGSPSIEMMIVSNTSDDLKLTPEDENILHEIYGQIKKMKVKQLTSQANYKQLENSISAESSNEEIDYETSTEASFERGGMDSLTAQKMDAVSTRFANNVVMNLKKHLRSLRNEIETHKRKSDELRMSLSEASDLIKPLNDHVVRIENERLELQEKISSCNQRLAELEYAAASDHISRHIEQISSEKGDFYSQPGQFIRISSFDLRKKDDEITSLKIAVNQLRDELNTQRGDFDEMKCSDNGHFDMMLTPTKSNKVKDKQTTWQEHAQSTNEEDYQKSRLVASEIERLKHDLAKSKNAEQTLKALLHDSSSRRTILSTQVEALAFEKAEAENIIKRLEKEILEIRRDTSQMNNNQKYDMESYAKQAGSQSHQSKPQTEILSVEVSRLTAELKATTKERKKLKKSLTEAVGMLNALRKHVETSEKERKKLKRHLRNFTKDDQNIHTPKVSNNDAFTTNNGMPSPSYLDIDHVPDPDKMENETTIINLRSHIIEMEHEIRTLEERINELEMANPRGETFTVETKGVVQESIEIKKLKEQLVEAQNAHEVANDMLNEIAEINKEMLSDLKETEYEAAEAVNELNTLRKEYAHLMAEIDEAKYVTKCLLQKLESYDNGESISYMDIDRLPLVDCINHLQQQIDRRGGS